MGKDILGQGLFAVRIEMRGGSLVAALTGEHFGPEEQGIAFAMARADSERDVAAGRSPTYLVKDSVIEIAYRMYRLALKHDASNCHAGDCGGPCGMCDRCKAIAMEQFTMVVLGSLDLPKGDLPERLTSAVGSAVGLSRTDAPWARPMTEEEVERVFDLLDVKTQKGEENESH